jgi:hypothetical protein
VNLVDPRGLEIAIPFNPVIIDSASAAAAVSVAAVVGAGYAGYNFGYGLAEWWDHYNDSSVMDNKPYCEAKGGKQNKGDTGLQHLTDEEIEILYKKARGKDKKRYERELKHRQRKNQQKRKSRGY